MDPNVPLMFFIFIIFLGVVFSFVAVLATSTNRRREREAFYRSETLRKIAEMQGESANNALQFFREQEKLGLRSRREGLVLGGMITAAVGVALLIFMGIHLQGHSHGHGVYLVALIPTFVGAVLFAYGRYIAPPE
jgi:hypothetical protein